MDRLVDRSLRDEILTFMPLHPNQHAYQAGKSVKTALHQPVVQVEKAFDQQKTDMGVFIDIEGVINNTSYDSICVVLAKQGVDFTIIRWIRATREGRLATATLGVYFRNVRVARACQ
jgi:hypothetical protein